MEIIPSILESDINLFREKLERLAKLADRIQVDFNDGTFERTVTLKPEDITDLLTPSLPAGRDYTEKVEFEAHLMVQKPLKYVPSLIKAGFNRIIVQYEIEENIREVVETLVQENIFVGLAIGPQTSVFEIELLSELVDTITVMDIAPGKQGQKFMPAELEKIRELKAGGFFGEVQADGGINEETFEDVVAAGPDTLVVGSNYERFRTKS